MSHLCNKREKLNIFNSDWDGNLLDDRNEAYGTEVLEQRCREACLKWYECIDEN
jgi:hypothetical protein